MACGIRIGENVLALGGFFIHGKRSLVFMANFSEDFAWIKFSFSFEVRERGDFFLRECQAFWEGLKELDDNKQ